MKHIGVCALIIPLLMISVLFALPASAQLAPLGDTDCETLGITCDEAANATSVGTIVLGVINVFLAFAGLIALIMIIVGGIIYIARNISI